MEHEMDVIEKEQTPKSDASDAGTAGKQSLTSHVEFSTLPSQGPVLRSKQRVQKHTLVRPWKSLPPTPSGLLEKDQKEPQEGGSGKPLLKNLAKISGSAPPADFLATFARTAAGQGCGPCCTWLHPCRPSQAAYNSHSSDRFLQAEEFFDMVATIQARRLNDQRADFAGPEAASEENPGISEDQLYDTILAHQSQRLEDQRTEPPIPVGIQGLLDLLLSAQGTRMEDQRSALPPGLAAPPLLGRQPSFLHGV